MNAAWRLHLENVQLRRRVAALEHAIARTFRCVYCGTATTSTSRVCRSHRDVAMLDADFHTRPLETTR